MSGHQSVSEACSTRRRSLDVGTGRSETEDECPVSVAVAGKSLNDGLLVANTLYVALQLYTH